MLPKVRKDRWNNGWFKYRRWIVTSLSGALVVLYVGVLMSWSWSSSSSMQPQPYDRQHSIEDVTKKKAATLKAATLKAATMPYKSRPSPSENNVVVVAPSQPIQQEQRKEMKDAPKEDDALSIVGRGLDEEEQEVEQEVEQEEEEEEEGDASMEKNEAFSSLQSNEEELQKNPPPTPAAVPAASAALPVQQQEEAAASSETNSSQQQQQLQQQQLQLQQPPPTPQQQEQQQQQHLIAGLSCDAYGGPAEPTAREEMIYWKDIPADAAYITPLLDTTTSTDNQKYFTFEPDEGGFNNIRMAMETAIGLAIAMGRTLVLPPKMHFYLLDNGVVDYGSFFHIDSIAAEHGHFDIITFEEFLQREAMTGHLTYPNGTVAFPPQNNRTNWDGSFRNYEATRHGSSKDLWEYMRSVAQPLNWKPDECVAGLPTDPHNATERLQGYLDQILQEDVAHNNRRYSQRTAQYKTQPLPVDTTPVNRLSELLANRKQICVYNETYQNARVVHGIGETKTGYRLLVHWYAYLFFEDWKQDLHMKRFMRDHFRYKDEIQCAAARIVQAVRQRATEQGNNGVFDTMHIRRGDFQYKHVKIDAQEIYWNNTMGIIPEGSTVYIATDERDRTFFEPLAAHYQLLFFSDFEHLVQGVSKNYYGMLDQLVSSKGRYFFGTYFSTFTGYINRLRGYHAQNNRAPGYENGAIESYYYVPKEMQAMRNTMRSYNPVQPGYWMQEFPVAWRLIDTGVAGDDAPTITDAVPQRR